jgi:antitoxin component YwqK of YwqJK toxin-antitoxin module
MPKLRTKRFYYRNGKIHTEMRMAGGQFHGLYRTWHRNGQLAQELRYRHGFLDGLSRQWAENGRLLGSFTMLHGTGLQRYWHDNGRLQTEINTLNGKFHGRIRGWVRDGTLTRENYVIGNRDVSRTAYLKAARKNPDWPQYEGEPPGRIRRNRARLERKEYDLFIQSVLENPAHAEAGIWLKAEARPGSRSLAKFATTKAALTFVKQLNAAGAEAVIVAAIYGGKGGKLFADWLLVQLPKSKSKRAMLRKVCRDFCRRRGGASLPDKDIGETHLYLMLA